MPLPVRPGSTHGDGPVVRLRLNTFLPDARGLNVPLTVQFAWSTPVKLPDAATFIVILFPEVLLTVHMPAMLDSAAGES